jgi:hypothetical protein
MLSDENFFDINARQLIDKNLIDENNKNAYVYLAVLGSKIRLG